MTSAQKIFPPYDPTNIEYKFEIKQTLYIFNTIHININFLNNTLILNLTIGNWSNKIFRQSIRKNNNQKQNTQSIQFVITSI